MNYLDLEKELFEKSELIRELQLELDETNRGILVLTMELEQIEEEKLREGVETIQQLQKELEVTNQGLLALTVELDQAKEKYRNILQHANEAIITFNEKLEVETFNPASLYLFGYSEQELLGISLEKLVPGFHQIRLDQKRTITQQNEQLIFGCQKNGLFFPVEITIGEPFYNEQKTWMTIIRDITERKKTEQGLRLMSRIFEDSHDAIMVTDTNASIIDINASFTSITGFSKEDVIGKNPRLMKSDVHPPSFYTAMWAKLKESGKWSGEIWDKRKNGEVYPKWLSISAVKNDAGQVSHFVGIFADITSRKEAENRLKQLAHYDPLTGLPNRTLFMEKLNWAIDWANREQRQVVLFFLDLDRFKIVNDTMGHQVGDQLLIEVANRLRGCVRKVDIVSRLAGDEFTIVLTNIEHISDVADIAQKVLDAFNKPVRLNDHDFFITTSIGITTYPDDGNDTDKLLKNADTAMYHAKSMGKNIYQFYSDFMNQKVHDELELELNLRKALDDNEFVLFYQPQIEINSGKIVGAEVLIRWKHPKLGFISPAKFIPYAERNDLILPIGYWVLRTACRQYVEWQRQGVQPFKISVNYSGVQLKQRGQIDLMANILKETGMNPENLKLELTESVVMEDAENTIKTLHEFKNMGISFSIDDFGTGYSSLSYLKRFPIDTLKIDKSFVEDIATDSDDDAIASTIIAMAHNLRLSVVAEGVETKEQLDILQAKGCDQVQDYYFCHPIAQGEFESFMLARA
jgi:diguanylate cyclase (GGDEF)-like protein/PAS domain S-box-containing protein